MQPLCEILISHAVSDDLETLMLEAAWGTAFGTTFGRMQEDTDVLAALSSLPTPQTKDETMTFPEVKISKGYHYIHALGGSSEIALKSPLRTLAHKFAMLTNPTLRKAATYKDQYIGDRLLDAWKRFSAGGTDVKSASDLLVEKEVFLSKKQNRTPEYDSRDVRDELYTFILGMNDTSATGMQWVMKCLTEYQDVQTQLRQELQTVFKAGEAPDATQMAYAELPRLDAFVFEVLRRYNVVPFISRETMTDVDILGHRIPKGTQIAMLVS